MIIKSYLSSIVTSSTLVINEQSKQMEKDGIIQLRVMPNIGMEGTCSYVYETVNEIIDKYSAGRAWVTQVEVYENEKNSAKFKP